MEAAAHATDPDNNDTMERERLARSLAADTEAPTSWLEARHWVVFPHAHTLDEVLFQSSSVDCGQKLFLRCQQSMDELFPSNLCTLWRPPHHPTLLNMSRDDAALHSSWGKNFTDRLGLRQQQNHGPLQLWSVHTELHENMPTPSVPSIIWATTVIPPPPTVSDIAIPIVWQSGLTLLIDERWQAHMAKKMGNSATIDYHRLVFYRIANDKAMRWLSHTLQTIK